MDISNYLGQVGLSPSLGESKAADNEVIGIAGFTTYAKLEETRNLSSSAPDVTLEDGSITHDTVFLDPVTMSISGSVSDIFVPLEATGGIFSREEEIIGVINSYLPARTQAQISRVRGIIDDAKSAIDRANAVIADGKKLFGLIGDNSEAKTLQEKFIDTMDRIHFSRELISIETPYRIYDNVRITSIRTSRSNESNELKFQIQAKQLDIRKLETSQVQALESPAVKPSEGLQGATDSEADKGTTKGKEVEGEKSKSILSAVFG